MKTRTADQARKQIDAMIATLITLRETVTTADDADKRADVAGCGRFDERLVDGIGSAVHAAAFELADRLTDDETQPRPSPVTITEKLLAEVAEVMTHARATFPGDVGELGRLRKAARLAKKQLAAVAKQAEKAMLR